MANVYNMTIVDYYQNLPKATNPKAEFVRDIVINCDVSEITVRQWLCGRFIPLDKNHREYLSKKTGIPVEELFPKLSQEAARQE